MPVLNLIKATVKKNHPYTIFFSYTPGTYIHGERTLTYTGSDFECPDISKGISKKGYKQVLDFLNTYYNYGPFDKQKINEIIKKHYHIKWG